MDALRRALEAHLGTRIDSLERLSGGACQENLLLRGEGPDRVFRLDAPTALPGSLDREAEARVVNAAAAAGVTTPAARQFLRLPDGRGGYIMDAMPGVAIGRQVVDHPSLESARAGLTARLGRELATIHSVSPGAAAQAGGAPVETAVATLRRLLGQRTEPLLAFHLIIEWLDRHRPAETAPVLVHGDFRTGNFLVTPDGLSAILDWEFAHAGAREEDLAWISVRDWRFGRLDRPVGGFGSRAAFYEAYADAAGVPSLDRAAIHWWEVYGNARWGLGCLDQAGRYLQNAASRAPRAETQGPRPDIELLAIGRRWTEMAFEAMRLIEEGPT